MNGILLISISLMSIAVMVNGYSTGSPNCSPSLFRSGPNHPGVTEGASTEALTIAMSNGQPATCFDADRPIQINFHVNAPGIAGFNGFLIRVANGAGANIGSFSGVAEGIMFQKARDGAGAQVPNCITHMSKTGDTHVSAMFTVPNGTAKIWIRAMAFRSATTGNPQSGTYKSYLMKLDKCTDHAGHDHGDCHDH